MSLDLTAAAIVEQGESATDVRSLNCIPTPTIETLFDIIQVCEISLSVASRHQFDAWLRGPLNSLIPHYGVVVWTHRLNGGSSNLATIEFESGGGVLLQIANKDTTRLGSELRRRWLMAGKVPLLLNANSVGVDMLPRIPEGAQIVIHAVDPLFGGAGNLFAMDCEVTQDFTKVLFMTQLIAPYLRLAVQRLDNVTDSPERSSSVVSRPNSATGLGGREIEFSSGCATARQMPNLAPR